MYPTEERLAGNQPETAPKLCEATVKKLNNYINVSTGVLLRLKRKLQSNKVNPEEAEKWLSFLDQYFT